MLQAILQLGSTAPTPAAAPAAAAVVAASVAGGKPQPVGFAALLAALHAAVAGQNASGLGNEPAANPAALAGAPTTPATDANLKHFPAASPRGKLRTASELTQIASTLPGQPLAVPTILTVAPIVTSLTLVVPSALLAPGGTSAATPSRSEVTLTPDGQVSSGRIATTNTKISAQLNIALAAPANTLSTAEKLLTPLTIAAVSTGKSAANTVSAPIASDPSAAQIADTTTQVATTQVTNFVSDAPTGPALPISPEALPAVTATPLPQAATAVPTPQAPPPAPPLAPTLATATVNTLQTGATRAFSGAAEFAPPSQPSTSLGLDPSHSSKDAVVAEVGHPPPASVAPSPTDPLPPPLAVSTSTALASAPVLSQGGANASGTGNGNTDAGSSNRNPSSVRGAGRNVSSASTSAPPSLTTPQTTAAPVPAPPSVATLLAVPDGALVASPASTFAASVTSGHNPDDGAVLASSHPDTGVVPSRVAQPGPDNPISPVHTAQLLQRAGESEMRMGLRTTAFGEVEVRTVVRDSQVGVSISSEHGDLRGALAADLPGLERTLHRHDLQLGELHIAGQSSGNESGTSGQQSAPQHPRSFTARAQAPRTVRDDREASSAAVAGLVEATSSHGISIHA